MKPDHRKLVVLRVIPQGIQQLLGLQLTHANLVDCGEQGELVFQALEESSWSCSCSHLGLEHVVDLRSSLRSLQLLTVQHLDLKLSDGDLPGHEGLRDL